jgi:hypothetical protein
VYLLIDTLERWLTIAAIMTSRKIPAPIKVTSASGTSGNIIQ